MRKLSLYYSFCYTIEKYRKVGKEVRLRPKNILIVAGLLILVAIIIKMIEDAFGIDLNIGRRQGGLIDIQQLAFIPFI